MASADEHIFFPRGIVTGPDGNLWVTSDLDEIVRMTPDGTVTGAFTTPEVFFPLGITVGSDGNLWFIASSTRHRIGRLELR